MEKNTKTDRSKIIPKTSKYDGLKRHGPGYIKRRLGLLSNEVDDSHTNKSETEVKPPSSD